MKQSIKVVGNEITANECSKRLREFTEDTGAIFGHGWSYRGGVYVVYVETDVRFLEGTAEMASEVLDDLPSVGEVACFSCEGRHDCGIDPDFCGRWLD